ncbi:VWA domain-containing protein [Ruficoccus amylovorans]|uniref:VWA domain-containing protein n=1 Tax=Ruficoccus amylovorans TaxID=1804625 RepID=A0A842HFQ6_9BACT|nr:VWA domain-containing protein [Ruficoccus amylovorans]MBC2594407.1 VWA domain-containing protein [Ruficoccus amylovorans]
MMLFSQPEWFLLIPALVFVGWLHRGLRLWRPLRVLCLALLTLILVDPHAEQIKPGLDLWVLVDRSDSARPVLDPTLEEWQQLIESGQGPDDTLHYLDFAAEASERPEGARFAEINATSRTDIPLAVQMAIAGRDPNRAAKILLLSDGYSTVPLTETAEHLRKSGLPLYTRIPPVDRSADTRLERFRLPLRVGQGEPVLMEVQAAGEPGRTVRYRLMRGADAIGGNAITFGADGRARLRLLDRNPHSGSHRYTLALEDPQDPIPGNNRSDAWVMIEGGPRVVVISQYTDDPVAGALQRVGLPVQLVTDFSTLTPGTLSGARAVLLNNVPAHTLPAGLLQALSFYVTGQGGGLAMLGGKHSFGSGGYFDSPIDEILPVSMELKEDHKKLAVAMAIVLDRSGSMSASTGSGQTKMDLANAGAAETVTLMGGHDAVTILAVDSGPHMVVPLTGVTGNQPEIVRRARSVVSMGGGIFVYTGLKAAWEELQKATAGQKHIILFADAADAEEPGDYQKLLKTITDAGATVSVIGLGTDSDVDADFLKDVATRGNGRSFFSANAADIPSLFAQETVAVTRSAFIDEPVGCQPATGWAEISPQPMDWPQQVDGYNLSYLRPRAASALHTTDEYQAPLLAFWHRGSGRTAAITFPLSGPYSETVRAWPGYGDLIQTLGRWLIGTDQPRGLGLRTRLEGSTLLLDLFYDEQWANEHPGSSPVIVYQQLDTATPAHGLWERLSPGHYRARLPLPTGQPTLGAVQWGDATLPFGPIGVQENLEWQTPATMLQALRDTARLSGGGPANLLEDIWLTDEVSRHQSLRPVLILLLAAAFLAEAAWFRWGRS